MSRPLSAHPPGGPLLSVWPAGTDNACASLRSAWGMRPTGRVSPVGTAGRMRPRKPLPCYLLSLRVCVCLCWHWCAAVRGAEQRARAPSAGANNVSLHANLPVSHTRKAGSRATCRPSCGRHGLWALHTCTRAEACLHLPGSRFEAGGAVAAACDQQHASRSACRGLLRRASQCAATAWAPAPSPAP